MTSCQNYCNCHWETGTKRHTSNRNSFVHSRRCVSHLLLCKKSPETCNFCKTSLVCFQVWSSEIQVWETGLFLWDFTRQKPRHQTDLISFLETGRHCLGFIQVYWGFRMEPPLIQYPSAVHILSMQPPPFPRLAAQNSLYSLFHTLNFLRSGSAQLLFRAFPV